jgi:large subunit ribosomal protein L32
MPPLPKRKYAKARAGERRQHLGIEAPSTKNCPQCNSLMEQHHACPTCGYYAGRQAVEIKVAKPKKTDEQQQK